MKTDVSRGEVEQKRQSLTTDDTENITQKEHNYKPRKEKEKEDRMNSEQRES